MLDTLRAWWNAPKTLAAERQTNERLRTELKAYGESFALVRQDLDTLRFYGDPMNRRMLRDRDELVAQAEAAVLAGSGPQMSLVPIRENASVPVQVRERMWELELALEDRGWQRQLALSQTEFSRYGLQQIMLFARLYYVKNPLIKRGVDVSAHYVFSRGFEITTNDDVATAVIKQFLADNQEVFGQIAMCANHQSLYTDGNFYPVLFRDDDTGALRAKIVDASQISDIITDPDDGSPQYYQRKWIARTFDPVSGQSGTESREVWYTAPDFEPDGNTVGGKPIQNNEKLFHLKVGGVSGWLFGLPLCYVAIDWARAYKQFLEDWATLNRALARFSWNLETKGGQQAVEQFQKVLGTTLGIGGTSVESNPPPVAGSTFVTGPGNKLEPIRTGGITANPEQGRRIMLMVAAAFGLPETFFGDASTGSLATAQSLDRPTELMFLYWQEVWREFMQRICRYALQSSNVAPKGKLREARRVVGKNGDLSDIVISIKFPAILEHDIPQMISAIVQGATLGGFDLAGTCDMKTVMLMVLGELGVEDPVALFDAMYPNYDPKDYAKNTDEPDPSAPQGKPHLVQPSFGAESAHLAEAIRQLKRASEKMLERAQ